jgi:glucosamine--fructose-6-phosphate aminotransferase (isomerizing)
MMPADRDAGGVAEAPASAARGGAMTLSVIEGPYWADIQAQPSALAATLEWLSCAGRRAEVDSLLRSRSWKRIVLTGMGSSLHALYRLHLRLMDLNLPSVLMETAELVHYAARALDADALVIAVSQSGASAETVRLLETPGAATMLGVTNTPGSPLAEGADLALFTHAGAEHSVSCKTYVASLLALEWLAGVFAQEPGGDLLAALRPSVERVQEYLGSWRERMEGLATHLHGIEHLFLVGRGASLAAALTGALILKESAQVHAEGMSSAAYRHGPIEMARANILTCVFSGDARTRALNQKLIQELTISGQHVMEIGTGAVSAPCQLPSSTDEIRSILEILPIQMMTLAFGALAGREAGAFERARKITDTE